MAYIQKRQHPNGNITYRARIRVDGMPDKSATFGTRSQAKIWAQKFDWNKVEKKWLGKPLTDLFLG